MPITVAEWDHLPATIGDAPSVDTRLDCAVLRFLLIYRKQNCLVTSAGRPHVLLQPFMPYVEI